MPYHVDLFSFDTGLLVNLTQFHRGRCSVLWLIHCIGWTCGCFHCLKTRIACCASHWGEHAAYTWPDTSNCFQIFISHFQVNIKGPFSNPNFDKGPANRTELTKYLKILPQRKRKRFTTITTSHLMPHLKEQERILQYLGYPFNLVLHPDHPVPSSLATWLHQNLNHNVFEIGWIPLDVNLSCSVALFAGSYRLYTAYM